MADKGRRGSINEIFSILRDSGQGISEVMIRRHVAKAGLPKGKDGKWSVEEVLGAILKYREEDNKNGGHDGSNPKVMRTVLQCQLLKIELDKARGNLISKEEVEEEMRQMAIAIKGALLALPDALTPRVIGRDEVEVAKVLKDGVHDCLRHLNEGK